MSQPTVFICKSCGGSFSGSHACPGLFARPEPTPAPKPKEASWELLILPRPTAPKGCEEAGLPTEVLRDRSLAQAMHDFLIGFGPWRTGTRIRVAARKVEGFGSDGYSPATVGVWQVCQVLCGRGVFFWKPPEEP